MSRTQVDFCNDPKVNGPDVLLHEALHVVINIAGPNDADLKQYLLQFGFVPGYGGIDDITQWLEAN